MRHPRLLPTAIVGLLCTTWFVDHKFMAAKIDMLSTRIDTARMQPPSEKPAEREAAPKPVPAGPDMIAKTLNDVTATIPPSRPPKPALQQMKNVSVKAKPTSIEGLLN